MAKTHLATYLNDHLAGSMTALELLAHLKTAHQDDDLSAFLAELYANVLADRTDLENLMARLEVSQSRPRQAASWLAEKMAQLKLRLDDPVGGDFNLLESFEILSLGIEGKLGLWTALQAASSQAPTLASVDYERLKLRAAEQRRGIEERRLAVAVRALQ